MPRKDPEQRRIYNAEYRKRHPEEERARHAKFRAAHPEKNREYVAAHSKELRIYHAEYRTIHREELRVYFRAHDLVRLEARKPYHRTYRKTHREERKVANARRRAQKQSAPLNDLTASQWREIKEAYNHRCVYCGRKMERLTMDHITPLSKGGSHTVSNVVPACASCNSKKHDGNVLTPIQPLLLTIADAHPKRKPKDDS